MPDLILQDHEDGVVRLTLNRPDRMNALADEGDGDVFRQVFDGINGNPDIRCVVLTGAGKAFSAGGNVKDMLAKEGFFAGSEAEIADSYRTNVHEIVRAVWGCQVPIIAAVNGPAVGLGHDVAGYCDIRIASDKARFGSTFANIGLIPGDGGAWLLPRNIGMSRASTMFFTGEIIDTEKALDWGLVSEVVAADELLDRAHAMARKIAAQPPLAIRTTKRLMREAQMTDLAGALEAAAVAQAPLHATEDHMEALTAFFEKRQGVYKGQ
ncbi:MAG: enoyl-CoA hydratase-related protein [Parvibaculales bacterium]